MRILFPFLLLLIHLPALAQERPNIVIIMADDLGYGDISAFDGWVKTPHLERMASEGLRFTSFYSSGTVCSPTRAGLLTGRYQQRAGIPGVVYAAPDRNRHHGLQASEVTFAEIMREAGYATGIFGKWHLGYERQYNPIHHGFGAFRGYVSGNVDFFAHVDGANFYDWWDGDELINEHGYVTHLITKHAVDFIDQHHENPFILYLPHEAPHYPYQGPNDEPFRVVGKQVREDWTDTLRVKTAYREMVEELDKGVGAVLDALINHNIEDNTLVLFFSDNGAFRFGSNGPLRDYKGSLWEGGIRVPGIAWWPGRIAAGRVTEEPVISIDVMPTMLALAGTEVPSGHSLDGIDISDLLLEGASLPRRSLFWDYVGQSAMRDGPWKLVQAKEQQPALFNLEQDVSESIDLAAKHPDRVSTMLNAISKWKMDVATGATEQPERSDQ